MLSLGFVWLFAKPASPDSPSLENTPMYCLGDGPANSCRVGHRENQPLTQELLPDVPYCVTQVFLHTPQAEAQIYSNIQMVLLQCLLRLSSTCAFYFHFLYCITGSSDEILESLLGFVIKSPQEVSTWIFSKERYLTLLLPH